MPNMFFSASVGFCALTAIIRAFRGETTVGNFFVDMWRVRDLHVPAGRAVVGVLFMQQGMPMTFESAVPGLDAGAGAMGTDDNGAAKQQTIVVGPVAAFVPIKQLGTNGGGFFGMNSAHPFENPDGRDELPHVLRHDAVPVRAGADVRADARPMRHAVGDLLRS